MVGYNRIRIDNKWWIWDEEKEVLSNRKRRRKEAEARKRKETEEQWGELEKGDKSGGKSGKRGGLIGEREMRKKWRIGFGM